MCAFTRPHLTTQKKVSNATLSNIPNPFPERKNTHINLIQMKAKQLILCMSMGIAPALFYSCASDDREFELPTSEQYGTLSIDLTNETEFTRDDRALNEETYKNAANYTVRLVNTTNDNVIFECNYNNLNDYLPKTLEIGTYRVEASYGTERAFSRNEFLCKGSTTFSIQAKEEKKVNVSVAPTCGKLSVAFDSEMATYFDDYSVSFGGTKAMSTSTCTWAKADTEPWYVAIDEAGETVNYTISLTTKDDYMHSDANGNTSKQASVKGSFQLQRNKAHKLTVRPNYNPTTEGALSITIIIDESTNDKEYTWEVPVTWI